MTLAHFLGPGLKRLAALLPVCGVFFRFLIFVLRIQPPRSGEAQIATG